MAQDQISIRFLQDRTVEDGSGKTYKKDEIVSLPVDSAKHWLDRGVAVLEGEDKDWIASKYGIVQQQQPLPDGGDPQLVHAEEEAAAKTQAEKLSAATEAQRLGMPTPALDSEPPIDGATAQDNADTVDGGATTTDTVNGGAGGTETLDGGTGDSTDGGAGGSSTVGGGVSQPVAGSKQPKSGKRK